LIDELRFHRELEYQEAQASLRKLQERYASVQVNGSEAVLEESAEEAERLEQKLSELEGELQDARLNLARVQEELEVKVEIAQSVLVLREKIQTLEENLQQARQAGHAMSPDVTARVQELEAEVQRARTEASPEELQLARRRISELEAKLASQPHGVVADGELAEKNRLLEQELNKTREQLSELNQELRRTLEGDRETKKLAYADQLTGLPNLNLTGQYLQVCFERSGRGEGALALILIDLDHFRRVNDALGQKAGDALLKEVGGRLQRCVTEKDTAIARRGEDEFMVVAFMENARVDGEALQARVRGIAHNLLNELAKPFDVLDQKVQVTASLGVALYPGPAGSRVELLEQSEHAMYKAKESGRARVNFYTEEMHNHRERRRYMESELKQALAQRQFGLVYQPIYEIASSKVVGVEALLRWSHPQRGVLEPKEFLEVAEDTGIIVPIGEQIIQEALEVAKQKFMKRRFLTLNLSFRQLIDSGFSARFMKHLQMAGVPPHEVMVEISEKTAGIDPDRIKNTLAHLAHWGVGIALDDFGTGSSELTHLTEYTLRVVKIDASLIARIPDDRAATKLCQAIAQMSNALEIPVLAEGVETREQLKQIAGMGCQYAQGLILGAPMNVSQLIQVL
jgi:diguanylate cyclase (GGDEF)-like protein